jgi:hypothetical protein
VIQNTRFSLGWCHSVPYWESAGLSPALQYTLQRESRISGRIFQIKKGLPGELRDAGIGVPE